MDYRKKNQWYIDSMVDDFHVNSIVNFTFHLWIGVNVFSIYDECRDVNYWTGSDHKLDVSRCTGYSTRSRMILAHRKSRSFNLVNFYPNSNSRLNYETKPHDKEKENLFLEPFFIFFILDPPYRIKNCPR